MYINAKHLLLILFIATQSICVFATPNPVQPLPQDVSESLSDIQTYYTQLKIFRERLLEQITSETSVGEAPSLNKQTQFQIERLYATAANMISTIALDKKTNNDTKAQIIKTVISHLSHHTTLSSIDSSISGPLADISAFDLYFSNLEPLKTITDESLSFEALPLLARRNLNSYRGYHSFYENVIRHSFPGKRKGMILLGTSLLINLGGLALPLHFSEELPALLTKGLMISSQIIGLPVLFWAALSLSNSSESAKIKLRRSIEILSFSSQHKNIMCSEIL